MRSMLRLLALAAPLLLCNCSSSVVPGDGAVADALPATDAGAALPAVLLNSCGPTDGPAFTLRVGVSTAPTCDLASAPESRDELTAWGELPTVPSTVTINASSGNARLCRGATCSDATSATITFTSITATAAAGTYRMQLAGSPDIVGAFTATRCTNPALCG